MLPESRPDREARGDFHRPPAWVADNAMFFITINCRLRGTNQLARPDVADSLFASIIHLQSLGKWHVELFLLMPDHLHALIAFDWEAGNGMNKVISNWKRFTARSIGIGWQRDFFDHRIRSETDHHGTWHYIRENPVRAGLVQAFEEWPYVWRPETGRGW